MTLSIVKGRQQRPVRTLIHGHGGLGKTTLACLAPVPVVLDLDGGSHHIDAARIDPTPTTWAEALAAIDALAADHQGCRTLVVDTLDKLQEYAEVVTCKNAGATSMTDERKFGYGKGGRALLETWRGLLGALDRAWNSGLNIVLVAHTHAKKFEDPTMSTYDRFVPKLDERCGGLVFEWVDDAIFMATDMGLEKKDNGQTRAKLLSDRFLYTIREHGFEAKNRHDLPPKISFTLDNSSAYWDHVAAFHRTPQQVKASIAGLLTLDPAKGEAIASRVSAAAERAGDDVAMLMRIEAKLAKEMQP